MNRNFRLTAVALALASLFPPVQAEENPVRMEESLLDWARANATTTAARQTPAPQAAAMTAAVTTHGAFPWDAERLAASALPGVLVAEESGRADKAALEAALKQWAARQDPLDRKALTDFLAAHPQSAWKPALLGNLGLLALEEGRYTQAAADLEAAWNAGKHIQHPGVKALIDRIGGELVQLRTQLGHQDAIAALLPELEGRRLAGAASEARGFAREGLWRLQNPDEATFLCGPLALEQLRLAAGGAPRALTDALAATLPGKKSGYTLAELAELAQTQGLELAPVARGAGEAVPVPSVVHWKSGHYAALLETKVDEGGRQYRVRDIALGKDHWISQAALIEEASGYFLAAREAAPALRLASAEESQSVTGASYPYNRNDGGSPDPDDDPCSKSSGGSSGMIRANVQAMLVSLSLKDTPIVYRPAKGPAVPLSVNYSQREAYQPATFTYTNLGPNWTFRGTTYIVDRPAQPGVGVQRYLPGGGTRTQGGFVAASGEFTPETIAQSQLVLVSADPIVYERRLDDGGKDFYSVAQTQGSARKIFITQSIDAAGNTLTYHYDEQYRLTHLTDATGGVTKL
ncbi:MAG: hypothetical protein LBE06_08965, partial [Azoarcus sp.]|nr:hypothetical protein [Azoarcus sp.]